jgi:L-histidine N-alpha-methyltransferase
MAKAKTARSSSSRYTHITLRPFQDTLAEEVRKGLTATPKSLPCKYFYDSRGLVLFDKITDLPEYYLTRVETSILAHHAAALLKQCPSPLGLAELGSGSSVKTRLLIEPCLARQKELVYYPIDILASALKESSDRLLLTYPALRVVGLEGEFSDGVRYLGAQPGPPRLVAFLGSTIGNFTEEENDAFVTMLHRELRPEDRFLLGADLLKDPAVLIPAYDDAQGVTAQFNLNIIRRINEALGADFDVAAFRHQALFNEQQSRIEMHLVSLRKQTVEIGKLGLTVAFEAGETIHTENCYKHSPEALRALLARHGFEVVNRYSDPDQWFGLFLIK